jgi:hypothetical protein
MKRQRDKVTIESVAGGVFPVVIDRATRYEIVTDLMSPSCARFELGDSGTWAAIAGALKIGGRFTVSVNGNSRMKGRLLTRNLAVTPQGGATVQLALRTRLADAAFTACDPKIGVRNTTLHDVVLKAFAKMGLTTADFIFEADTARDLITGRRSGKPDPVAGLRYARAKVAAQAQSDDRDSALQAYDEQISAAEGRPVDPALTALREDEARVHPPETIWSFVERHLARFGLMIWDGPDGRIVIGKPDDSQKPLYIMTARRGKNAVTNNLLSATKVEDFEDVPAQLWVFGFGGGREQSKTKYRALRTDPTLLAVAPSLDRSVMIIDESIRTPEQAAARARKEMMRRSMQKDCWTLETDGLTYWNGTQSIAYAVDTVADVRVDVAGGASGAYLIHQCTMTGDADNGHTTRLVCSGRGIWDL